MKTLSLSIISGLLILASSCSKDLDSEGGNGINYHLKASRTGDMGGSAFSENGTARVMASINWTSGFANVTQIKFEAESDSSEVEYKSTVQQRIDLFSAATSVGNLVLPAGTYKEVEFEVKISPVNGEPALELSGDYAGTPVIIRIQRELELEAERENVTIAQDGDYKSVMNLNLTRLNSRITDADLANAQRTDGKIIISETSNADLYSKIFSGLDDWEEEDFDNDDHDDDDDGDDD